MVEAAYTLKAPIPAGSWTIVGDGIVVGSGAQSVTVRFEARWRKQGQTDGNGDTVLATAMNTFTRDSSQPFDAVPFTTMVPGIAADADAGDLLVLRVTAVSGDPGALFILNGEGKNSGGNIPRLDLPFLAQ